MVEDASVVVDTLNGLVVISGCGHAGMINTIEYARKVVRETAIHAAVGGFHLLAATDDQLAWTAAKLREYGLGYLLGVHCTWDRGGIPNPPGGGPWSPNGRGGCRRLVVLARCWPRRACARQVNLVDGLDA